MIDRDPSVILPSLCSSPAQVSYFRDTYAEHPEDRENIEHKVCLQSQEALTTLSGVYGQMKDAGFELDYARWDGLVCLPCSF